MTDSSTARPCALSRSRGGIAALTLGVYATTAGLAAQDQWVRKEILVPRTDDAVVHDTTRNRTVLFGGRDSAGVLRDDTWEWDGQAWARRVVGTAPAARERHACVFDPVRQRVLLFGGHDGTQLQNDTWEWDGAVWHPRTPANSPSPRRDATLAFDSSRNRVVLFGGSDDAGPPLDDTWEWDGSDWFQRAPANTPPGRSESAMVWDGTHILMFGGSDGFSGRGDLWAWDGNDWSPLSPPRLTPAGRLAHGMAYDPLRARVVLFGGASDETLLGTSLGDTWEFDGNAWTNVTPTGGPIFRRHPALIWHPTLGRVVLFGGLEDNSFTYFNDTWSWSGSAWDNLSQGAGPQPSFRGALAYDEARGESVLISGSVTGQIGAIPTDTWTWNGRRWHRVPGVPVQDPGLRFNTALAYDAARERTVLFGGRESVQPLLDDTWEWDGSTWTRQTPALAPSPREAHAMAYDRARGVVVLFGGRAAPQAFDETWLWDGVSWQLAAPANRPPAGSGYAMAYDEARQRVVLFGGFNGPQRFSDTWEWNGIDWLRVTPATTTPPGRIDTAMTYDPVRGTVVLYGGSGTTTTVLADLWEWDGVDWQPRATTGQPPARNGHSIAYDRARQRLVVFGGNVNPGYPFQFQLVADTLELGALTVATATRFGRPCIMADRPEIATFGLPTLGNNAFAVDLLLARANAPAFFGFAATQQPVALGPCVFYLGAPLILLPATTNAAGFATLGVPIPDQLALAGAPLIAQAIVSGPFGLKLTRALRLTLGE